MFFHDSDLLGRKAAQAVSFDFILVQVKSINKRN
jgi:hypothetical protein